MNTKTTRRPKITVTFVNKPPKQAAQIIAELIFSRLNRAPDLKSVPATPSPAVANIVDREGDQ